MEYSPILLFVFNRPNHVRRTIAALQRNTLAAESVLYIYSDAARTPEQEESVNEVRKYIHSINGFKEIHIIERKENWGLARNIIDGVTTRVKEYGKVIVLEDDLVTAPYFLQFMNDALYIYKYEEKDVNKKLFDFTHNTSIPDTFIIKCTVIR